VPLATTGFKDGRSKDKERKRGHAKFLADGVVRRVLGASCDVPGGRAYVHLEALGGGGRGCEHIFALWWLQDKDRDI
jgi:hypothetical protein